jgi:molybdate transport system substrate-binding protein
MARMRGGWLLCLWLGSVSAWAGEITVAVAANFTRTMEALGERFEARSGHRVRFSFGPTGKLYAQIRNGAPFDLFFAADTDKTARLVEEGLASDAFVYARGRLVLYSPELPVRDDYRTVLVQTGFRHLAIANPKTAPYGAAALAVLQGLGVMERVRPHLVHGESIAHAFQYVATGNAALGFLAWSQLVDRNSPLHGKGEYWLPPQSLYPPLDQAAVLLVRARDNAAARALLDFVKSSEARAIIEGYGYGVP